MILALGKQGQENCCRDFYEKTRKSKLFLGVWSFLTLLETTEVSSTLLPWIYASEVHHSVLIPFLCLHREALW